MRATDEMEAAERRRLGRTGGALLIISSLTALPAGLVLEPPPEAIDHLVSLAGILVGIAVWLIAWERVPALYLYVIPIIGTAEVMVGTALFSDDFAFYQVLIGVYTAYVVRERVHFLAFMAFFAVATLAPLLYVDANASDQVHHILVTLPVLLISATAVRYLRDTLEERERQYRRFALEAVSLSERIRGGSHPDKLESADDVERKLAVLASETRSEP